MAYGQTIVGMKEYVDSETGEVVKAYTTQTEGIYHTDRGCRRGFLRNMAKKRTGCSGTGRQQEN